MIARWWKGRVKAAEVDEYVRYVEETGIRGIAAVPGNRLALVLTRIEGDEAEVGVLSLWDSMEAIRAFAGENPDIAVYYPEDDRWLLDAPRRVAHFDVPEAAGVG
ncbi:MAG: hypothetical protein ABFS34_07485 [Gemmatimonadota bacterium]